MSNTFGHKYMWPFLPPRIVYGVLGGTGTTLMSLNMTLDQKDTKMHNLCHIEMSNDALNGVNRIIWSFGALLTPLLVDTEVGQNMVFASP